MRTSHLLCRLALTVMLVAGWTSVASAQGFFESLFGGGSAPPPRIPTPGYGYRTPIDPPRRREPERSEPDNQRSGSYRTLCVRMCDGYYWPISNAVSRARFYRDANVCKSSCGEEARLFYQSAADPDTNDMVDLSGRAYAKLPSAYLYRKRIVDGCTCKPEPWSQSELDRHATYTEAERRDKERIAVATAVPVKSTATPAGAATASSAKAQSPAVPVDVTEATKPDMATVPIIAQPTAAPAEPDPNAPAERKSRTARKPTPEAKRPAAPASPPPQRFAQKPPIGGTQPSGLGGGKGKWPGD